MSPPAGAVYKDPIRLARAREGPAVARRPGSFGVGRLEEA
jgi:hypothetical protein